MKALSVLIVEDEKNLLLLLERVLKKEGYETTLASRAEEAIQILETTIIDIVITDIRLPGINGLELLHYIKKLDDSIEVIIMTAFATIDSAIEALKMGARDYIRKPFKLEEVVEALKKTSLQFDVLQKNHSNRFLERDILVDNSPKMKALIDMIKRIADSIATIYINGETGVGKELVVNTIHELSSRRDKPLIKINCSALPETLLESELFGYEKGAFTGAYNRKLGRFELANGGTIFLDEIGDISPMIQLKLLRILQFKEFERLGGVQTIPLDVRIIVATNKHLENLVKEGKFREDLFYRLNVIPLYVPALRERRDDIKDLITLFMGLSSETHHKKIKKISEAAMEKLVNYTWPGNVRELENIVERLLIITEKDTIELEDLPSKIYDYQVENRAKILGTAKEQTEATMILEAIKSCEFNITRAAESLGISRRSLHRKINKYDLKKQLDRA